MSRAPDPERGREGSCAGGGGSPDPRLKPAGNWARKRLARPRWKRWLTIGVGWGFVLLGIAGLVLPILQGFLFLGIGLILLSRESRRARAALVALDRRYPRFRAVRRDAAARAGRIRRRLGGNSGL